MCAFFSKLLNTPTEPEPKPFNEPIFLLGIMRSGTTLLMNILSEHPQLLKVGFELNKIWTEIGGAPCSDHCDQRTELDYEQEYANNMTAYFTEYINNSKSLKSHLARWAAKRHYGSGGITYDWDNVYPMNKSPHLSNKIRYLNKMYPKAKYIAIIRSLEGQVASMKMHFLNHHKTGNYSFHLPIDKNSCWTNIQGEIDTSFTKDRLYPDNFKLLPEAWLRLNTILFQDLQKIPEDQKLVLTYEDLMENKSTALGSVFDKLSLKQQHNNSVSDIIGKQRKVHNTTTKGDPLSKWKKYLSEEERKYLVDFKVKNSQEIKNLERLVSESS